jgi:uncharacterized damage-inducible protein DinB
VGPAIGGAVIADLGAYVAWFEGVHRRTLRDVRLLPAEAEGWAPPAGEGEASWGIPRIVQHTAEARPYFVSAFLGRGWVWDPWPAELTAPETWSAALDESMAMVRDRLDGAEDRLGVKVELIGGEREVSGWRLLMMMAEHEVHHRAQISTYAGMNGWPVAQTFDRTNEWVVAQRDEQLLKREG